MCISRGVLKACVEEDLRSNELWQVNEAGTEQDAPVMGGGHSGEWVNRPVEGLPDSEKSDINYKLYPSPNPPPRT